MTDTPSLVERLCEGIVYRVKRWCGDTHSEFGGSVDEEATESLMYEAACEIQSLQQQVRVLREALENETEACAKIAEAHVDEAQMELDGVASYASGNTGLLYANGKALATSQLIAATIRARAALSLTPNHADTCGPVSVENDVDASSVKTSQAIAQERDEERLAKLSGSRNEALLAYSARERAMISKLEMIATGRSDMGDGCDLDVARSLAFEALEEAGWPTVRDCERAQRSTVPLSQWQKIETAPNEASDG